MKKILTLFLILSGPLCLAASGVPASGTLTAAQDDAKVFQRRMKLAEKGDVNAQFIARSYYLLGRGVAKDYTEAYKWYRQAADQGYAAAQGNANSYSYLAFFT